MLATVRDNSLLNGISLAPGTLRVVLLDRLTRSLGKHPDTATQRDVYDALSLAVREELAVRWLATQRRVSQAGVKRVCYLSVEFLLGRTLVNGLSALDGELVQEARETLAELGFDLDRVAEEEIDPGLGNGGLGRLAACFLDSLATLQYPAVGYGIRYDYGIFTQAIDEDGRQREIASSWLRQHNPWEIPRDDARYVVRFGGRCVATPDPTGQDPLPLGRHAEHLGGGLRPADPRQSQPDRESPAALVGARDRAVRRRDLQRRPTRGSPAEDVDAEEPLARALPGRHHAAGQGAALQAAVLLRQREPAGHPGARTSPRTARSRSCPTRSRSS